MSKNNQKTVQEDLANVPNAKKFPPQQLIDDYIEKAGKDPEAIKEMIKAKRKTTKEVISQAQKFYADEQEKLSQSINQDKSTDSISIKDSKKYKANIAKIQNNISEIQKCIEATELNVSDKISRPFDKKFDAAQKKNKLMKLFDDKTQQEINDLRKEAKKINNTLTYLPSEKQIANQLKYTNQALKTWQELAKARDDRDRSKGFAKLSDNLASMVTTSLNAPRKALALGQALLTYAVVDVLYEGLVKGSAKGLVKGAGTGYKAANDAVTKVANNIHKIVDNSQKNLDKEVKNLMDEHTIQLLDSSKNIPDQNEVLTPYVKSVESKKTNTYTPVTKDYLDAAKSPQEKALLLMTFLERNDINVDSLKNAYDKAVVASKPSLPTRVVAGAAGIVPAIVTGIVNAAWEGIKKPTLAATVDMPKGVGNRLTNLKKDKEWARTHSEVKQHREAKKMAEAIGAYAKKAQPAEFNKMVKEKKAQERAAKKQHKNPKGMNLR
jgi:hypothetical protein